MLPLAVDAAREAFTGHETQEEELLQNSAYRSTSYGAIEATDLIGKVRNMQADAIALNQAFTSSILLSGAVLFVKTLRAKLGASSTAFRFCS